MDLTLHTKLGPYFCPTVFSTLWASRRSVLSNTLILEHIQTRKNAFLSGVLFILLPRSLINLVIRVKWTMLHHFHSDRFLQLLIAPEDISWYAIGIIVSLLQNGCFLYNKFKFVY
jgi:hypothetical protein